MGAMAYPFVFSTPVWGSGHVGLFLNVGLPSLLAPGNLPGLTDDPNNRYLIYTRSEYERDIRVAHSYRRLASILAVEIIPISEEIQVPHHTMSNCHADSLRRAEEANAAAVFIPPDCVWSDRSMVRLETLARSGKSVVHISGIRLNRDGVVPEFAARYSEDRTVLTLEPRELADIGLRHLHRITRSHFFDEYGGELMPANLVWSVEDEGLLLRCFHLHPLLVKPQVSQAEFESTIDDDLALRACPDSGRDYVVTDSDELLTFEMSSPSHVVGTVCPKGSIEGIAAWKEYGTNNRHRELIRHCIRIHSQPLTDRLWRAKEIESSKVIDAVDRLSRLSQWQLLWGHPAAFIGLLQATVLGRIRNRAVPLWVLAVAWMWLMFQTTNAACYQALFISDGSLLITHPLWLIRRAMLQAIERCIGRHDQHIIIISADPGLAIEVGRANPDVIVTSFTGNDPEAMRQAAVDLLVVADLPIGGLNASIAQRIGKRQVLLRLPSDRRDFDKSFNEVAYFGGLGTRFCCHLWVAYIRLARKPRSPLGRVFWRSLFVPISSFLFVGASIVGAAMNFVGIILDFLLPS
jgi:hypothetical protein